MKINALSVCALFACAVGSAQTWSASPTLTPFPNDPNTGTAQYTIVKMNASGQAVTAATTDTTGFIGIVQSNAGILGYAGIAQSGIGTCQFDNSTHVNDYVIASTSVAGDCHDAGATFPTTAEVMGRAIKTNTGAGAYNLLIYPPEIRGSVGGAASWGLITGTLSSQTDLVAALAGKQATIGFTPENAANKNAVNGYAGLNGSSQIAFAQIPVGTSGTTVAVGNDARFGDATSLNGTNIASFGGIPFFTAGVPAPATASSLIALFSGCSGTTFLRGDGTCASAVTATTWGSITGTLANQSDLSAALAAKQNSLGYTPENVANKNVANGYAGLGAGGLLTYSQIPVGTGVSTVAAGNDNRFGNATSLNGTSIATFSGLPWFTSGSPAPATFGNIVSLFTTCTSGYLRYDGTCSTPTAPVWGAITGTLANQTDLATALSGKASSSDSRFLNATSLNGTSISAFNGLPWFSTGTPAAATAANVVSLFANCTSGYLRFDGTCAATSGTTWGSITGTLSNQSDLSTALAAKASSSDARFLNATSLNGTSIAAFSGIPNFSTGTPAAATSGNIISLFTACTSGYLRYDGTCSSPAAGVTSFSVAALPAGLSWLTNSVTNATSTPQYTLGLATGQPSHQFIGTGTSGAFGPVAITQADIPLDTYTVGAGGVTQNVIVGSSANPGEAITPAAGVCGFGVAQATVASGGTVAVKSAGLIQVLADGAISVGRLVTCSPTTGGYISDTGATSTARVPNTTSIVGVVTSASTAAGTLATIRWHGPGTFGTAVQHSISSEFTSGGAVLTSGAVATVTVPYACVINAVNINLDAGGATFDVWKVPTGTAAPTVANSIVGGNYPAATGGLQVHSTALSGWSTSVAANDIVTFQLRSVTGSPTNANLQIACQ